MVWPVVRSYPPFGPSWESADCALFLFLLLLAVSAVTVAEKGHHTYMGSTPGAPGKFTLPILLWLVFISGFVLPNGMVWGRPVGMTLASGGSLLMSDDGSESL